MATVGLTYPMRMIDVPATASTLDGFREWARSDHYPECGHITFVGGRLMIDMSPERYETHLKIKEAISRIVGTLVADRDLGDFYPDGGFVTNEDANISNEPDGMFATWKTLESGKLAPPRDLLQDGKHIELVGTPDWVCEIVSDSSVEKDSEVLLHAYHKAGIAEYWLVDARGETIDFQVLAWQPEGYVAVRQQNGWRKSTVFDCQFQLTRHRDRLHRWRYELESRD